MPTEQLAACRNFHGYYHISGIRSCWKDEKKLDRAKEYNNTPNEYIYRKT